MITEGGKAVLKDADGALQLVDEGDAQAAVNKYGFAEATAADVEADNKRKAYEAKPFTDKALETGQAAVYGAVRPFEAAVQGVDALLTPALTGKESEPTPGLGSLTPEARDIAERHPIATALGGMVSEAPLAAVGGIPGAALRIGQAALQGSAETSFLEGGEYKPKLNDALFYGGLQAVFEGAVPASRALKRLLPERAALEESVEAGRGKIGEVFNDPDPVTRANALSDNADDVTAVLGGQAELNAKYLNRETRKFLDSYFGKRMGREGRRDSLGYFSGKVSDDAANYAQDLKHEWAEAVKEVALDDPSDVIGAWANEQLKRLDGLPNDPRVVHRAMLESQIDSPLASIGFEEVDEMLDTSIRDLLSGTDEGAEMLRRYDELAEKGLTGRSMQTLKEFGELGGEKAGAAKEWIEQPQNRAALRDAVNAIDAASGMLHATGVPGAAKTLRAATSGARTLLDHYDELAEAVAGKGIREAATAGATTLAKTRADELVAKYGPAVGAGLGALVGGLPGAVMGGLAGTAAARSAARGPFAEKALGYARGAARTRVGKLATNEAAIAAADVVGEHGGRVTGMLLGHTIGGAIGGPIGGLAGGVVGSIGGWTVGRMGSKYLEEPLKKLGAFAARERGQTARALVTPSIVGRAKGPVRSALSGVERVAPLAGIGTSAAMRAFSGGQDDNRAAWVNSRDTVLQSDDELTKGLGEQYGELADEYPELFDEVVQHAYQTRDFLRDKMPPASGASLLSPDGIAPDRYAQRKWALYYTTALAPSVALDDLRNGRGRIEQVETLKALHPELYTELRNDIVMEIAKGARPSVAQRARLNLLFDLGPEVDSFFAPSLAALADSGRAKRAQVAAQTPGGKVPGASSSKGPAERYASPMRTQEI